MSSFLLFSNIHLGLELLGAVIFFIVSWLFFEAYFIKRDLFSLGRALGFLFLSFWQVIHVLGGETRVFLIVSFLIYSIGLLLIFLSYWLEKLPQRPENYALTFGSLGFNLASWFNIIPAILLTLIFLSLTRRYFKDIDRIVKWLAVAFILLALSAVISNFSGTELPNPFWILEHLLRLIAFGAIVFWIYKFLSLRIREEALIVFIATSLFIALLVTTTFSVFLFQRAQKEAENNLAANAKILKFYIDSLKNKTLASSQIIANNDEFISSVKERNTGDLEKVGNNLLNLTGQQFLTVASKNGDVFFKANFPIAKDENILSEKIGAEALEGRAAAVIEQSDIEKLSIRAAAPVFYRGEIVGAIITGFLLNDKFTSDVKKISNLETSIFAGGKVLASTILVADQAISLPEKEDFIGAADFSGQKVMGAFIPLKNFENKTVGVLSITTTPGEILKDAQAANRLTMLIISLIVIGLVIPLYRFTVFLTSRV